MSDLALDPAARFRSLSAAIIATAVTSAIFALSLPLFSARLDAMGHTEWMIGVSTAAQAVSLILVAPFVPRLLRAQGPALLMIWLLAISFVLIMAVPLWENAWYWLVMRLLFGASSGMMWIAVEAWVNGEADDSSRGRILALYGISAAAGTAAGFGILVVVGFEGWLPFLVMGGLMAACALPAAAAVRVTRAFHEAPTPQVMRLILAAPTPLLLNLLVAVTFSGLATFLPVYGPGHGIDQSEVALLLLLLSAGGLLQYPIGWLADRMNRRLLVLLVMAWMAVLFALMSSVFGDRFWIWPYVMLLGVGMMGLYTLALTLLGARFRAADIGAATTMFQVMWNIGMAGGPFVIGFVMEGAGDESYPWSMVVFYVVFMVFVAWRGRREGAP